MLDVSWPGVLGVEQFEYTCLHGTQPGVWRLVTVPQLALPHEFGNLSWTDGGQILTLQEARLFKIDGTYISGQGTTWELYGHDERWVWRNKFSSLGQVSGRFNQRDDRGELVPYTVRSPDELAILCLQKMGVVNYRLRLPPGLSSSNALGLQRRLFLGERFPPSGTNPEFNFDHTPASEALELVVGKFNCRVIYQPFSGLVLIAPVGVGRTLPNAPMEMTSPTIDNPEPPKYIAVYGAPIRIQARFLLEPVGKEWHGYPIPIDDLSYAPVARPGAKQVSQVLYDPTKNPAATSLKVTVTWTAPGGNDKSVVVWDSDPANNLITARFAAIASRLNANADFTGIATATNSGNILTITGKTNQVFNVGVITYLNEPSTFPYTAQTTVPGSSGLRGWESCPPPDFPSVQPTDRLAYMEAVQLARESIWKWWRITLISPGYRPPVVTPPPGSPPPPPKYDPRFDLTKGPIDLNLIGQISKKAKKPKAAPGVKNPRDNKRLRLPFYSDLFGPPIRRQQIILQDSKVEQITPQPRIAGGVNAANTARIGLDAGILAESYSGRSFCQAGIVRGSVYKHIGSVLWTNAINTPLAAVVGIAAEDANSALVNPNTRPTDRVFIGFKIVNHPSGDQLVVFDEAVYAVNYQTSFSFVRRPRLVLETGCMVLHPENDQVLRWEEVLELPGGVTGEEWHAHEDLQVGVVGRYDVDDNLRGWKYGDGDLEYVKPASNYYLNAEAIKYKLTEGATIRYPLVMAIEPDPSIQQITWVVGKEGPITTVGINNEFHPTIPDYPARRRQELLSPNKLAADANAREREWVNKLIPQAGGTVK